MQRKDREIVDVRRIENIIAKARYMHLGLLDGEYPYVVPMHYGYTMKDGKLTFFVHCAGQGHKLDCMQNNNSVFVEIDCEERLIAAQTPCRYGAEYESVMCRGKAMRIEDAKEKCEALRALMKTQTGADHVIDEKMADKVTVIRIDVESYTAKTHAGERGRHGGEG